MDISPVQILSHRRCMFKGFGIPKPLFFPKIRQKGKRVTMADGSTLNWRKVSSSDKSPAVDIDIERSNDHGELVSQKIHFTKR